MAMTQRLAPTIVGGVENETITFDFGRALVAGVTITSVVAMNASAHSGVDASASTRWIGSPVIVASPKSGAASVAVSQLFGNAVVGVDYLLQCVVDTSDGQRLSLETHLLAATPQ